MSAPATAIRSADTATARTSAGTAIVPAGLESASVNRATVLPPPAASLTPSLLTATEEGTNGTSTLPAALPSARVHRRTALSAPAVTSRLPSAASVTPSTRSGWAMVRDGLIGKTHERSWPSAPVVTRVLPVIAMPVTAPAWAGKVAVTFPSAAQRVTFPSVVPAATAPFGRNAAEVTAAVAPAKSRVSWPVATAESFTDLSAPPVSTLLPSADSTSVVIASAWAGRGFAAGTGNCQNLTSPSSPIVNAWLPPGLRATPVAADP